MADKNEPLESKEPKALVIHDVVVAKRTLCRYTTCNEKEYMYGLCKNHLCQQWH